MDPQSQTTNPEQVSEQPVPIPSAPVVPPVQPQKSNTLLLILIGLVLIVLSGGGGFYLGSYVFPQKPSQTPTPVPSPVSSPIPTADPIANWKKYTNSKYGYTVDYPSAWEPNRGPGNLSNEELSMQRDFDAYDPNLPGEDPGTGLAIMVNELDSTGADKQCANLEECFEKTFSWLTEKTTIEKQKTSFLGELVFAFTYQRKTDLYSQSWKYIYFIHEGNAYNIHISTNTTREKETFELFDQILSTFEFTE